MYLLLEVLKDCFNVYDTETQLTSFVPKTLTQVSGVVNDYIRVPYSDYEIRLAQLIKFDSVNTFDTTAIDSFSYIFDRNSLMCMQSCFNSDIQYISIFGYILNNWSLNMLKDDYLVFNLADVCIKFRIVNKDKFIPFITKFKISRREIRPKLYRYVLGEHLVVYEGEKIVFTAGEEKD